MLFKQEWAEEILLPSSPQPHSLSNCPAAGAPLSDHDDREEEEEEEEEVGWNYNGGFCAPPACARPRSQSRRRRPLRPGGEGRSEREREKNRAVKGSNEDVGDGDDLLRCQRRRRRPIDWGY